MNLHSARGKLLRPAMLLALLMLSGAALTACGSSNDGTSTSKAADGGGSAKGTAIKVMSLAPINSQTGAFPAVRYSAQAYEKWVNANGGIGGRPLSLTFCDTQGTPAKLASCAQQAVRDKVVAVVGGFVLDASALIPVLKAANIAWMGSPGVSAAESTSSNVFAIGGQPAYQAGGAVLAQQGGCKKLAVVVPDIPAVANAQTAINNGYKSAGGDPSTIKYVKYAPTTTDYGTTAAKAASGTDCIYAFLPGPVYPAWLGALKSVGAKQKLIAYQGEIFPEVGKKFAPQLKGALMSGAFEDYHTSPAWAKYRQALAAVNAPSSLDYAGPQGQNTWAAFNAFAAIAKGVSDLNAQSFLSAASKATSVDTGGLLKPLDFTKTSQGALPRDFNRYTVFFHLENGAPVADGSFRDMTSAIEGK